MISKITGLIRFSMGLLVALALVTSCGSDQGHDAEVGAAHHDIGRHQPAGS